MMEPRVSARTFAGLSRWGGHHGASMNLGKAVRALRERPIANPDTAFGRTVIRSVWKTLWLRRQLSLAIDPSRAARPLNARYLVSDRYRFVYFRIFKAGSSSIYEILKAIPGADCYDIMASAREFASLDERFGDFFKFTIVRNPYDRAVSCYRNKIAAARTFVLLHNIARTQGLRPGVTFDHYCRWLASPSGADAFADIHMVSQHRLVYRGDHCRCDFVGRLERIGDSLAEVATAIGVPGLRIEHVNRSEDSAGGDASAELTVEAKSFLAERYAEDFRIFGYDA